MIWINPAGYELFRVNEDGERPSRGEICEARCLAVHRVLAYGWGIIDSVYAPVEVDHCHPDVDYSNDVNVEWNLQALPADDHGRETRRRASA